MKKSKNILLLTGAICFAVYFLWSMVRAVIDLSFAQDDNGVTFVMANQFYPALLLPLLMVLPILLMVRNLKGKEGKVLPILSVVVYAVSVVRWLVLAVTPAAPQYLIYSKLGLIDTYYMIVVKFFGEGGLLLFAGYLCTLIGSILSLPKRNRKAEEAP